MGLVVADTGSLRYLVLLNQIDVLPRLIGSVAVPAVVLGELRHPKAPDAVRAWAIGGSSDGGAFGVQLTANAFASRPPTH